MAFLVAVGVVQFVYCVLMGNYVQAPFLPPFQATAYPETRTPKRAN